MGIGSSGGVASVASSDRYALLLSEARDPVATTGWRTSIEAWDVDGELAWTRELTTGTRFGGKIAASEDTILASVGQTIPAAESDPKLCVLHDDGTPVCEQSADSAQSILLEAAPAWGPDTFVRLDRETGDGPIRPLRLARLQAVR